MVWVVRVSAKDEQGLKWLKANEFPLRRWFREHHSIGQAGHDEGQHPHSLYVGPDVAMGGLFMDMASHESPPFIAKASAQTELHCEQTIADITAAILHVGGSPADFEMRFAEDRGEHVVA